METIKTSQKGWLAKLTTAYKNHIPVRLIDDADIGIDPTKDTLLNMGRKANLNQKDIYGIGISLGISSFGMVMIVLAFLDPEPTSKLGLLVGSGAALIGGGGVSAFLILTKIKPPTVKIIKRPDGTMEIEILWEKKNKNKKISKKV
jgi:hypothetical protein